MTKSRRASLRLRQVSVFSGLFCFLIGFKERRNSMRSGLAWVNGVVSLIILRLRPERASREGVK
ncbi:DUF3953 domain-containing protein [Bradyrhizobium sp. BR 10261]|uniref:DUF3953 domain-containing protein n=1 Tax=Bradyrhizobium sp. BR 10261 TaxID=2749992 RepID=UPI001C64F41F|nr:DUF3953 domain-containing protein [Bradyrhizobium sp. BR 10261]